jgi:hypothetical protein
MGPWHVLEYITRHPTACTCIHLKELTDFKLFKKCSTIYGTRKCITMFTKTRHLIIYWARWIQSVPYHPAPLRPISVSSCHIHAVFPADLSTKILHAFLFCPKRITCPSKLILLYLNTLIISEEENTVTKKCLCTLWLQYKTRKIF